MYKLQGHSLTRGPWFLPESQSLSLTEKGSTSSITMPMDSAVQIQFNDWLYDEDVPGGDPIVWRVKSISESSNTNTVTVELEHVIRLLEDQQIFGEVTTEDISGGTSCTARQAIEYLLSGNFDWQLGALEVNNSLPYEFETLSVYDAIESVTDTLEGVYWEYDLTQHPFVLNVRLLEMDPDCEMREGRNLSTLKRSVSRTGMYTRIYPIGENDLHIPGDYISNNEEIYGRIDKVVTDSTKTTIENLGAWAHGLLMHNSDPDVTITISGLELSEATNEPMDRLRLNRFCRCPLPEYATTIIERITKLYWKDLIKDRESVTVTLANNMKELSEIIKTESNKASGGSGAAGQAKQNYLFQANGEHLLYEVFDENGHLHGVLRMTSESLRIAFENLNESTRSEFRLTSESLRISFENEIRSTRSEFQMTSESLRIHFENEIRSTRSDFEMTSESLRIQFENDISSARSEFRMTSESLRIQFENDISSARSEFQMTAQSLRVSFENDISSARSEFQMTAQSLRVSFENDISSARSAIQATADAISAEVTRATGAEGSLSGRINVAAGRIDQIVEAVGEDGEVTAASIVLAINESTGSSEARIDADHVYIGNSKSTTVIAGKAQLSDVTADYIKGKISSITLLQANALSVAGGINGSGTLTVANLATFNGSVRLGSGNSFSKCLVNAAVSGSTLTITDSNGDTVNFNKAVALSGAWSGTRYAVSATSGTISGTAPSTSVYLEIEGAANPNATINAKIYKDNPSTATNQLTNIAMTLSEDVTNKKVTLSANSLTKGSISTAATYNAGWNYGLTTRVMSGTDAGSTQAIKTLDYGQHWRVRVTLKNSSGNDVTSDYVVASKADRYNDGYGAAKMSGTWSNNKLTISKNTTGSASLSYTVSAAVTLSYNSSTHTYLASGSASCDGAARNTATTTSGTEAYDAGVTAGNTAGYNSAKMSGTWSNNKLTISKNTTGSASLSYTVSAAVTLSYNSSAHTYLASGSASCDGAARNTATTTSGTEAYDAGVTDGNTAGYNSAKMSGSWSNNTLSISKDTTGSTSLSYTVSAAVTLSYNSSTHTYLASGSASCDGATRNTATTTSGTEAYDAGVTAGKTSAENGLYIMGSDGSSDTKDARTSVSINPGGSVELWPAFWNGSEYVWGTSCTVSGNGTRFYDGGGNSPCTLYYRMNGTYYSAGNHTWYWV